ncbi:MAG: hypothetical protein KDD25_05870 [Bdellovibrionales bacterium]|nr:hypothetical protein [Bdellovibrionales bacterium]
MNRALFTLLFGMLTSQFAEARVVHFYASGGGESATERNRFTDSAQSFGSYSRYYGKSEDYRIIFDGNRPTGKFAITTGEIADYQLSGRTPSQETLNKKIPDFTPANFASEIDRLIADTQSGKIKKGDSVIVTLDTHGSSERVGHQFFVSTNDGLTDVYPKLERLRNELNKRGIKLGIISGACHSQPLLDLANKNTCVITGSNENVGYMGFVGEIYSNARPGKSLEEVYLKARLASTSKSVPQISTQTHDDSLAILSEISSLTRNHKVDVDRLFARGGRQCRTKTEIQGILGAISDIFEEQTGTKAFSSPTLFVSPPIVPGGDTVGLILNYALNAIKTDGTFSDNQRSELANAMISYEASWQKLSRAHEIINSPQVTMGRTLVTPRGAENYTYADLGSRDFTKEPDSENIRLRDIHEYLMRKDPKYVEYRSAREDWANSQSLLENSASTIAKYERLLYDRYYRTKIKNQKGDSSPCANIKF